MGDFKPHWRRSTTAFEALSSAPRRAGRARSGAGGFTTLVEHLGESPPPEAPTEVEEAAPPDFAAIKH